MSITWNNMNICARGNHVINRCQHARFMPIIRNDPLLSTVGPVLTSDTVTAVATVILSHKIALDPTEKQKRYFRQACGVSRHAYNWGLAEWKRQYRAGEKPSALSLKKQYNAIRAIEFPWSREVTKCAGGDAFSDLRTAYKNFFDDRAKAVSGKLRWKDVRKPRFKKKGKRDSFALWNDQFRAEGDRIRMPHIGWVRMKEPLRYQGKIMGATVSRQAGLWFVSIAVETVPDVPMPEPGTSVGIDLGITHLMILSKPLADGTVKIDNPKPRRVYMKRQAKLQRRISGQELVRRKRGGRASNRQRRRQLQLSKLHYRIANIRKDAIHKATTMIANNFETIYLEDLNVRGMTKNHRLAGAILDAAPGETRRQFQYKTALRGGEAILIDRFYPSSKTCSDCGHVMDKLPLHIREWDCPACLAHHDRDENAAKNIELVGQAMPKPSLATPMTTHGEMEALASASVEVKLPSVNRELNPEAHASTY